MNTQDISHQDLWTDDYLEARRFEADDTADRVVAAVYTTHSIDGVNRLLMNMAHPTGGLGPAIQALVNGYMNQTAKLPDWADPNKIKLCETFFSSHGLLSSTILCCASLPECYLDARDAPVLTSTTQLTQHVERRFFQTAQMVTSAMQTDGIVVGKPDDKPPVLGPGVRCAQRVRLMHAAVRHLLIANSAASAQDPGDGKPAKPSWNMAQGKPINQESMAFVILTFSYVGLRSLDLLGRDLTPEIRQAYIHTWSVIGHVMGVNDDLLAHNYEDAQYLFEAIKRKNQREALENPSLDRSSGQALTQAMLAWMESVLPDEHQSLPKEMLCLLMGDADSAMLGVTLDKKEHVKKAVLSIVTGLLVEAVERLEHLPGVQHMSEKLFHQFNVAMQRMNPDWKDEAFGLPPSLQKSWCISTHSQESANA